MENIQTGEQTAKKFKLNSVQKRTITSVCYLLVLAGMCAMKWCVPWGSAVGGWGALGFDAVFTAISVIGAYEFLRAVDNSANAHCKISTAQRTFAIAFCAMVIPLYVVITMIPMTHGSGFLAVACAFVVYVMFLAAAAVFNPENSTVRGTIYCIFCMLYCGVLAAVLSSINHLAENSMAAILALFLIAILTDSGAYVVGSLLKKFIPLKLSPKLSPNKTVIGAIGGVIGGILAGLIAYYIMFLLGGKMNGVILTTTRPQANQLLSFMLVGLITSVMCQIGDLFESAIKREFGIKDMGTLLPGHGGVLDRFDSMLYSSVGIFFCFIIII